MKFNLKKVFIVAELSANHGGDIKIAIETIKAAKRAGADGIKLQTYKPSTMTINSGKNDFIVKGDSIWDGRSFYDLYEEAHTPWEWHEELFKVAKNEGLVCFSTPFDKTAVDFLENLGNPIYKIASFEITDIPLIDYIASKGKPIIISTGIAKKSDIKLALKTIRRKNSNEIVLLKCTSSYPAPLSEVNLLTLTDYTKSFNVIPGLSDHTLGITAPIVAAALGARVIEKHFIIDKYIGGPDSSFSLDFNEFSEMVKAVRSAELSVGSINYKLSEKQKLGKSFCRSIYIVQDVKKGDIITGKNIKSIRPGFGMHPKHLNSILGKRFSSNYSMGTRMSFDKLT
tara:strand:- start:38582 stop:39604 length:1023 start_codon:yes stop_codon:yes gene_type:complete